MIENYLCHEMLHIQVKSVKNIFSDDVLRESLTIKPFQNVNENEYAAISFGFERRLLIL